MKLTRLLDTPPTVTTTLPLVAPLGTTAVMLFALQLVAVANVPLNRTVLAPWLAPKLLPAIVTGIPTGPEIGERLVIEGVGITVKFTPLLGTPPTVATTFPLVAPLGTITPMLLTLQLTTEAAVPLNVTVLDHWLAPRLLPVIVTAVPAAPIFGETLVIEGAGATTFRLPTAKYKLLVVG